MRYHDMHLSSLENTITGSQPPYPRASHLTRAQPLRGTDTLKHIIYATAAPGLPTHGLSASGRLPINRDNASTSIYTILCPIIQVSTDKTLGWHMRAIKALHHLFYAPRIAQLSSPTTHSTSNHGRSRANQPIRPVGTHCYRRLHHHFHNLRRLAPSQSQPLGCQWSVKRCIFLLATATSSSPPREIILFR
ncbi:uncharacterized protein BO97DRAFT_26616 [Aspergillus homomorphus CBS 101889]|uniref:Uncharacterized protein n=1 Tax=Aspergillus homomorphus (strain CBS 101889) TaxID=1450537 RepID=A0A395I1K6_ASPHC|nr:hypothetical protein BO97DRAFT_26616 [Aspergillus homomorphus CBS 101889]RAL13807.1 hypothetical protein BO97DRAFT_26616 [Aspergillus homomorphus CBS 101889]